MTRLNIPEGAWMRYKKQGRTLYAQKTKPITWKTSPPPSGTKLYVIGWFSGQGNLQASRIETQP